MREGRYRKLHCLIWNDDKFPYVSDDCQLVFFHLYFNPLSTPFGLFKASLPGLAADKRWLLKRYEKAFREGLGKGFFSYDEKFFVVYFPMFLEYNPPPNANVLYSWRILYKEIPNCELKRLWWQQLKALTEGFHKDFVEAFKKGFGEAYGEGYANTVSVTVSVTDTEKKKERRSFLKPSVEEIKTYCQQRGNSIDPQAFYDFYEAKGWMIGKNSMKDWQAAIRTWEKRQPEKKPLPGYMRPSKCTTCGRDMAKESVCIGSQCKACYERPRGEPGGDEPQKVDFLKVAKEMAGKIKA